MSKHIIGPRKPRKLTIPLNSTVEAVRKRFRDIGFEASQEMINGIALSEDQYIEDWKTAVF